MKWTIAGVSTISALILAIPAEGRDFQETKQQPPVCQTTNPRAKQLSNADIRMLQRWVTEGNYTDQAVEKEIGRPYCHFSRGARVRVRRYPYAGGGWVDLSYFLTGNTLVLEHLERVK
jgi:hypothetical protein